MRRILSRAVAAAGLATLAAVPSRAADDPVVAYSIEVTLDPAARRLEGSERLVWHNPSSDSVSELQFHLYWNAFAGEGSIFFRELGGRAPIGRDRPGPEDWGSIEVLSIEEERSGRVLPAGRFLHPDGGSPEDRTVLAVTLPEPVPPRGKIALRIRFRSRVPRIFARTGVVRDFHLVGQWFPKLGVYEPAGTRGRKRGGWNCHAFHANSEFYADFGDYDVAFTVPSSWVVGATGEKVSETRHGATATHRYRARNVHDFAWTADPRYLVHAFRFDPARDVPPGWRARAAAELGLPESELVLSPVDVRLLLQPEHAAARERYVRAVRAGFSFYGLWFGPYPYGTLTVVDPPDDGLEAGGMEYPTFITGLAPRVILGWPFAGVRLLESATVHELGHQYWYGMVASNEFEEPWLDEGVNADSEYRAMAMEYGPRDAIELPGGIGADSLSIAHAEYASLRDLDPISRFAWRFASRRSYGVSSYAKVALFLAQMRADLGTPIFARAQRAYFREWAFRHPSGEDFFSVFERVSRRDLSRYRRLVYGRPRLDWSVVTAADADVEPGGRAGRRFGSTVLFGNSGDWPHGARARAVFTDGATLERDLPADASWVRWRTTSRAPLAWVSVDPRRANAWDASAANDSRVLRQGRGAARTLGARAAARSFAWAAYLAGLLVEAVRALA